MTKHNTYWQPQQTVKKARELAFDLYGPYCLLSSRLRFSGRGDYRQLLGQLAETLGKQYGPIREVQGAHVFGRGAFPVLKTVPVNIVPLNGWSHKMLDEHRHPVTGRRIGNDAVKAWWRFIVGAETFEWLDARKYDGVEDAA